MVKELKEMGAGIEPNLRDYAPRGISGFYEKQFKRLRTGLQPHDPDILNAFVNVVAASSGRPLPINILLKCMNLSDEKYKIRNTIINKLSEIIPVHDNCLTVYHKSLTDWFTLVGYEEHEFVADVADGTKRLWEVCKGIYRDIDSTKSLSNFELSRERKFALENGRRYLVDVGDTVDFHWLVNVRLNALKFRFCGGLNVDYCRILNIYKSSPSDDLYWSIFQHYYILNAMPRYSELRIANYERDSHVIYLQFLANGNFDFETKNLSSQNTARDILVQENEMWIEDVRNVECRNTEYKLISSTVHLNGLGASVCSPNKKLLVLAEYGALTVLELPSLSMIFKLQCQGNYTPTFSPDSSYFLCGSIRSCVCIRKQKEVAFILGGPEHIKHCSFSSCGKKLVTVEENVLTVWDVEKRELLVQVENRYVPSYTSYYFSSCNKYILEFNRSELVVRDSTTLEKFQTLDQDCSEKCPDSYQITYLVNEDAIYTRHYHLSPDEVVVIAHADSFTWKNRKCQISSCASTLFIYDFINRERVDRFQIDCLPVDTKIDCISKLDGTNFLLSLDKQSIVVLSLETSEESSVVSYYSLRTSFEVTLSPDHLYVACCYYDDKVLIIRSVDNGETLETVELQKPPEACWWSELYLWVFCDGAVVRFSYYSTRSKVLGSGREVCPLTFYGVLGFGEGVFVFTGNDNMITILKICDNMPFIQKIGNPFFHEVAISKDGCTVILFHTEESEYITIDLQYQVWEFTPESCWELHLNGKIETALFRCSMNWLSLTGTQSCRRLVCVLEDRGIASLFFFDFTSRELYELYIPSSECAVIKWVVDVAPNVLLIIARKWWNVVNVSDHKVVATLSFGDIDLILRPRLFYLSSKGLLLVVYQNVIKCFKIHNIENCLTS